MRHCDKVAVTVNPTNHCNLRCKYCMASSAQEQLAPMEISIEFAKQGISDAISGIPTEIDAKILRFFSPGEPTQNIETIRKCVHHAKSLNHEIELELQTNGLFSGKDDTHWIADNFNAVWFSLDGPAEINAINRVDEYGNDRTAEIEENMRIVQEKTFAGVRATVVGETINYQDQLVDYFYSLGIDYLCLNPVIWPIQRRDDCAGSPVTQLDIMHFAQGFLKANKRAHELGVHLSSSLTFNFDEPTITACRSCIPMPQLNPDGSVSSCDMALYADAPDRLQCFIYGKWNYETNSIDYDNMKIKSLRERKLENLPLCKHCDVKDYCAGGCAGRVAYEKGNIYDIIPSHCEAIRFLAKHMTLGAKKCKHTHP